MGGCRNHQPHHHQSEHHHQPAWQHHQERNAPTPGGRSLRNRRYRRAVEEGDQQGQQQAKRLFTPQIKRFLKGWLVRRRNNPYPNRTEKKELAFKTGLTYIQICNWFANWRRKLKNSSRNTEESWGHLIKDYNNKAKGNVEQFSISSDDSIWDETAFNIDSENNSTTAHDHLAETDHCYYSSNNNNSDSGEKSRQGRKLGGNDGDEEEAEEEEDDWGERVTEHTKRHTSAPELLSKWLESAATYTANTRRYTPWNGYNATWQTARRKLGEEDGRDTDDEDPGKRRAARTQKAEGGGVLHQTGSGRTRHREELDAAEALAHLSAACLRHEPTLQCH